MKRWTTSDIPSQAGKLAIVTGANSGIGRSAARELARCGAKVVLACRDPTKGNRARAYIVSSLPQAAVETVELNLADLASVRFFAATLLGRGTPVDLLINNAGVLMSSRRKTTVDGFETTFGTNHLGHFALTGLLMPLLLKAPAARIVTVSSLAHKSGRIDFDDLQREKSYSTWGTYAQSKLANLLFGFELERRLRAAGKHAISIAVHPGISQTQIFANGPGAKLRLLMPPFNLLLKVIGQSEARGALPTLFAATSANAEGGKYYGPDGLFEYQGNPIEVAAEPNAHDQGDAKQLWEQSELLTSVRYPFGSAM